MYRVSNQYVDLDTTANHRMYVSQSRKLSEYDFVRADEIEGKNVRYKKDAEWDAPDYQFVIPAFADKAERAIDMEAFLIFLGIWISEGWTIDTRRVAIYLKKDCVKKVFEESIKRLGYEVDKISGLKKWTINDVQLANYVNELAVGAPNKFLPEWVFKLSQSQARILVESMVLSDGNAVIYSTKSTRLADQFSQLCLHAGWSATKTTHIQKGDATQMNDSIRIVRNYDLFRISVNKTRNNPEVNHPHYKRRMLRRMSSMIMRGRFIVLKWRGMCSWFGEMGSPFGLEIAGVRDLIVNSFVNRVLEERAMVVCELEKWRKMRCCLTELSNS